MVKIRVNPTFLSEFRNHIKDIDSGAYKEYIENNNVYEDRLQSSEFEDWKYEYKNSTVRYYDYIIFDIKLNDKIIDILKSIFPDRKTINSQSLWYKKEVNTDILNPDIDESLTYQNKFTIYVITKGRWQYNYTIKSLEKLKIKNYKVVVEIEEVGFYINSGVDANKIIIFDKEDKTDKSSVPVRNFVWHYSQKQNELYHWILDDNIKGFYRWNRNKRFEVDSGYIFTHIEDYILTKNNVAISGMNYLCFNNDIDYKRKLITKNTRIYSCILIKNEIPGLTEKWRGRFNEDTDLSIRILKLGYASCLFNNYLCNKLQTGKLKGGNQELYKNYTQQGYTDKTQALIEQHPDIVKTSKKFGKDNHHLVNYKGFQNNKFIK